MSERPIAVDLFAGAGGMTFGFERAGFDVLAAVELDPIHCATHEFNFPFWSILCASVTDLTGDEIRRRSAIGDRDIDVVFGGPPCQGFSMIGKRALDDARNNLMFHFVRLVSELKPKFLVIENVQGLTVGLHKQLLLEVIEELKLLRYEVADPYRVLNAADYGVPQNRRRLFVLGCRKGFKLSKYPQPTTQHVKGGFSLLEGLLPSPTVWDAIGDLPSVEKYPELWASDAVRAEFGKPSDYAARLRGMKASESDFSYKRKYDSKLLTASLLTEHTELSMRRFTDTSFGDTEPVSRFFKLDPKGICNTIRAGTPSNQRSLHVA